jgi:hypothetical protein
MYRVLVVKPNGSKAVIHCFENREQPGKQLLSDSSLRNIIADDKPMIHADPQILHLLDQKVRNMGRNTTASRNSLFEIFLPLFSLKQIELKMALISLALVISLGIGPSNNQAPNRNLNLFFLADTLSDTSVYFIPSVHDSAVKMLFK